MTEVGNGHAGSHGQRYFGWGPGSVEDGTAVCCHAVVHYTDEINAKLATYCSPTEYADADYKASGTTASEFGSLAFRQPWRGGGKCRDR